eukprot:COSAG04_NODE_15100_length_543_cov_1.621622_1_plen_130_part_00
MDDEGVAAICASDRVRVASMTCDESATRQLNVIIPHGHKEPEFDMCAVGSKRPEPEPEPEPAGTAKEGLTPSQTAAEADEVGRAALESRASLEAAQVAAAMAESEDSLQRDFIQQSKTAMRETASLTNS